jgi:hypothetical protein
MNPDSVFINRFCFSSDHYIMMGNYSSAAWTAAPLDECLDKLGTCEATVSECETRTFILEAQMAVLRHPKVVIGLACGVAVLLLLSLLRCLWHMRAGAVQGAFPWDLFPGWLLRRVWRVVRWPFVQVGSRLFGPQVAEGVAGVMDELAVSPDGPAPVYATIRHPPSVPTFRGVPAGAVLGVPRADFSAAGTRPPPPPPPPSPSAAGTRPPPPPPPPSPSAAGTRPPPPPPPPSPSAATVFFSATSRQLPALPAGSLRSSAGGRILRLGRGWILSPVT